MLSVRKMWDKSKLLYWLNGDGEVFPEHGGEGFWEERDEREVCRGGLILWGYFWRVNILYFGCIGVPRQKSVTSQRERAVPDVVIHHYGKAIWRPKHQHGRRKSAHMLLWQRQYKQQHGWYGINDLLYIADTASHEHTCATEWLWITAQVQLAAPNSENNERLSTTENTDNAWKPTPTNPALEKSN
jgi:hypothetical protein